VQQFQRSSLNIAMKFQRVEALARQLLIREEKNIEAAPKAAEKKGPGDESRRSASLR
jgi:hypothetical protein